MNLQTKIPLVSQKPKITYASEVLLLGSCFAENIGAKFEYYKFKNLVNPFGILFHPKAIETLLWMIAENDQYTEEDLFFHNENWHCFDAHSTLSNPNKSQLLTDLNTAIRLGRKAISSATHISITLGTSWVYRLKALDLIVANCHKIPQKEFSKELLSVNDIVESLQNCIHLIRSINTNVDILFTVSPVRHIKDGIVANNRSKSHLLTAVHQVVDVSAKVSYFPSYEIVMDELRDYRFYKEDMVHPRALAIDYIWERFYHTWISEKTADTMKRVEEIQRGMAHKPFYPKSEQHLQFLEKLETKKSRIQKDFPFIQF